MVMSDGKITTQGPPVRGRCLFCNIDLDALAADGKVGHVCDAKPNDHADGSAYEHETDHDAGDAGAIILIPSPRPDREDWHGSIAASLGEVNGNRFRRREFVECDACRGKPGAPTLCVGCLANRTTVGELSRSDLASVLASRELVRKDCDDLRAALAEALGRWQALADDPDAPARQRLDDDTRIAELRAKFILGRDRDLATLSFPDRTKDRR